MLGHWPPTNVLHIANSYRYRACAQHIFAVCRKLLGLLSPYLVCILTQESPEYRIPRAAATYLAVIRPLTNLNSLPRITFQDTDGERFGDRPKLWVTVWVYRQSVRRQCLGKWWVGVARAAPPSTPSLWVWPPIWGIVRVHLVPATHPPNFSPNSCHW